HETAHLRDHLAHGNRARIPAAERNDAEGAAVIAAVLHLHECPRPPVDAVDEVERRLRHAHDVVDDDLVLGSEVEPLRQRNARRRPGLAVELLSIAEHAVDFLHGGEGRRLGLGRTAGDDDAGIGPLTPEAADGLARLAHSFGGHRTGIDHDRIVEPGRGRLAADHFRLVGIEPAAEGDDVDVHRRPLAAVPAASAVVLGPVVRAPAASAVATEVAWLAAAAGVANAARSKRPANSY